MVILMSERSIRLQAPLIRLLQFTLPKGAMARL